MTKFKLFGKTSLSVVQNGYGSNEKTPLLTDVNLEESGTKADSTGEKKQPSLMWALAKTYGPDMLRAWSCKLVYDVLTFVGPMLQS